MLDPYVLVGPSGTAVSLYEPQSDTIHLTDIAHHLGRIRRFNGAPQANCSVALHSVICSHLVPEEAAIEALFHDAHEYVTGDQTSPLLMAINSNMLANIRARLDVAIFKRIGVSPYAHRVAVKRADLQCLKYEKINYMPHDPRPWPQLDGVVVDKYPMNLIHYYDVQTPEAHTVLFLERCKELGVMER